MDQDYYLNGVISAVKPSSNKIVVNLPVVREQWRWSVSPSNGGDCPTIGVKLRSRLPTVRSSIQSSMRLSLRCTFQIAHGNTLCSQRSSDVHSTNGSRSTARPRLRHYTTRMFGTLKLPKGKTASAVVDVMRIPLSGVFGASLLTNALTLTTSKALARSPSVKPKPPSIASTSNTFCFLLLLMLRKGAKPQFW